MAFSDTIKHEALKRSAFRCCICHDIAADAHHIIPQYENGKNTISNAAPLCASCHDLFGDNPSKRKKIRQMRDYWWAIVRARNEFIIKTGKWDENDYVEIDSESRHLLKNMGLTLYHVIMSSDTFEDAAQVLFSMIFLAQKKYPNQERYIFIDIVGHRNENGGFDNDIFELQSYFNLNVILSYVTRIYSPLICVQNKYPQNNNIPDTLEIFNHKEAKILSKDKLVFKA
jgi:hypothetical protein